MRPHPRICSTLFGALAVAGYVQAGQPPDVVKTDGNANTAMGTSALLDLTVGCCNTGAGNLALTANNSGAGNTAFGAYTLYTNQNGSYNTAAGYSALNSNTGGDSNVAFGVNALLLNNANDNTALGSYALQTATSSENTAIGFQALYSTTTGLDNIAVGHNAGYNLTTGDYNIDIGNHGVAGETETIRIGGQGTQKATYIAGIYGKSVSGNAVMVNSEGQLGVAVSSERFKTDIAPMGSLSNKLQELRPVTFHLKIDPHGNLQYGLIAEQVAQVLPDLVIRDPSGRIDGVRYDELAPMLLNELQTQEKAIAAQVQRAAVQDAKIDQLERQLATLQAGLVKSPTQDGLVAQR